MATAAHLTDPPPATPESIDTLTDRNLQAILHKERSVQSDTTIGQRFAGHVAAFCGSMTFVWIQWSFLPSGLLTTPRHGCQFITIFCLSPS